MKAHVPRRKEQGNTGVVRTNPGCRGTNEVSYTRLKSAEALKGMAEEIV